MIFYNTFLVQLFISIAICSQDSRDTDAPTIWTWITGRSQNIDVRSDINITKSNVYLKVYYETLCPASVQFLVEQLTPAVKRLGSHLDVHLIPYGHATTYYNRGQYYFRCQHGHRECYCNKVHACAIDVLRNNTQAILFNSCLMEFTSYQTDYKHFVSTLRSCGHSENVHIYDIWKCVNGTRGSNLLKGYGDETHSLAPPYVPYLVLDGSAAEQDRIAGNLIGTVCQKLKPPPSTCINYD